MDEGSAGDGTVEGRDARKTKKRIKLENAKGEGNGHE